MARKSRKNLVIEAPTAKVYYAAAYLRLSRAIFTYYDNFITLQYSAVDGMNNLLHHKIFSALAENECFR